jgi:hypothetical protein
LIISALEKTRFGGSCGKKAPADQNQGRLP